MQGFALCLARDGETKLSLISLSCCKLILYFDQQ